MNSRIIALLALSTLYSGCTQVSTLSPGQQAEPVSSTATGATEQVVQQDQQAQQAQKTQPPQSDLQVGITTPEDPSDLAVILQPATDTETREDPSEALSALQETQKRSVIALCNEIGNKLGSVSVEDCLAQQLIFGGGYTVQSRPMVVRDFHAAEKIEKPIRVLIMGGIHGDEYSSISILFKWMAMLEASSNRDFHWRFAPTVNPDGLLYGQAIRQNANGVDLNRNFPSKDWVDLAEEYWANITNRNPRRYPGSHPASEPEVQWVVGQIEEFKPDVIVSVHAPYHLLDYDGPPEPPQQIGELHLHLLGVYPGSLGNYAGINLGIPVVTMELPSAGIMPPGEQISSMWDDLLAWLYEHHDT